MMAGGWVEVRQAVPTLGYGVPGRTGQGVSVSVIVTYQQEVTPMNAVSPSGAPLASTILRRR